MQDLLINYLGRDPTSVIMGYLIPPPKLPFIEELRGHPMTYINKHQFTTIFPMADEDQLNWLIGATNFMSALHGPALKARIAQIMASGRRYRASGSYRKGKKRAKRNRKRNHK